jgi:hypothetical protein
MASWSFGQAQERIAAASAVLDTRDEIAAAGEPAGLAVPASLEEAYETAVDDLGEVAATADSDLGAAQAIADADEAAGAGRSVWAKVGLWGADPEGDVAAAARLFEEGKAGAARQVADDASALVDGAQATGQRRVGAAVAAILVLIGIVVTTRMLVHRRRARRLARSTGDVPA